MRSGRTWVDSFRFKDAPGLRTSSAPWRETGLRRERLRLGRRLGPRAARREATERLSLGGTLAVEIAGVGRELPEALDPAGRPANLDRLDVVGLSKAELEAWVAGSLVAAAAKPPGDTRLAAGGYADFRPDGIAVRGRALQTECQVVAAAGLVVGVHQWGVEARHEEVEAAVVVEVADGQGPPEPLGAKRGAGAVADVRQAAVGPPEEQLKRHRIRRLGPEVVHVSVRLDQVEPAVVVGVQKGDPEAQAGARGGQQVEGGGPVSFRRCPDRGSDRASSTRYRSS